MTVVFIVLSIKVKGIVLQASNLISSTMYDSKSRLLLTVLCGIIFLGTQTLSAQQSTTPDDLSLGSIEFPTSTTGAAQKEFLTGVLALHSFWYPEARTHFQKAQELDPNFAMAYWGEAMTYDHPLWGQHDQKAGAKVLQQLDQQIKKGNVKWSEREKAYVKAIRILYDDELKMNERRNQYADTMKALHEQYPSDETLAFWALAAMTRPSYEYSNPDVRDIVPIVAKLEQLYKRNPQHPGGMHYLIHAYDNDKFAEMGLRPARDYSEVAYSSSHAIHMPSHIFKQLEMWDKVIQANIRAWQASVEWQQNTNRPLKDRDYHSYRWLFEAYLEVDNFEKACDIIQNIRRIKAEAKQKGQDMGHIPESLENFEGQYEEKAGESAPLCTE